MVILQQLIDWINNNSQPDLVIGSEVNPSQNIIGPRAIEIADANQFTFLGKKYENVLLEKLSITNASLIFLHSEFKGLVDNNKFDNKVFAFVSNPKKSVIDLCKMFFIQKSKSRISDLASIHSTSKIGENAIIDPYAVLESNVIIGSNCRIGSGTIIKENTVIGNDVEIASNTVIGGIGFGYARASKEDRYEQFPHFGKVIIHDNVHIGSNTCIDKGSLKDTVIHKGVRIDNLVHIAHNVEIGENTLVIACSLVAGSTTIGSNSWIAPSSTLRNGISIGNDVTIGMSSTVTKSVENNAVVTGSPAVPLEEFIALRKYQKSCLKEDV